MSKILTDIEQELRKRASNALSNELDDAIHLLQCVCIKHDRQLFNACPQSITERLDTLKTDLMEALSQKAQDEAVRKASCRLMQLMGA
jgi:hypothetical protein